MKSFQVKILKESFVQRISQGRSCNANESLLMHFQHFQSPERKIDPAKYEREFMQATESQVLIIPSGKPLSMFDPYSWSMCFLPSFFSVTAFQTWPQGRTEMLHCNKSVQLW